MTCEQEEGGTTQGADAESMASSNDDLLLFPDSDVSKGMISNSNDGHDASTEEAGKGAAEGKSATPAVLVENRATYANNLSDDGVQRE